MGKMAFSFSLSAFNFRKELRLALLAAMETCWVYAVLVFAGALMNVPPFASPLTLFIVYWLAMILGRELPRRTEPWVFLQAAAIVVAIVLLFLVARIELYPSYSLFDLGWIPQFISVLVFRQGFSRVLYTTVAVVYMFIRGLGFGSRPLTLWFIGFQFRLGIVIFFAVFFGSAIFHPVEISPWIFIYFALSLFSISLARMDEMGSDIHYGPRWAMILLGGVALVFFLGFALLQFFTLDSTSAFLRFFSPLIVVIQAVVLLILIPASLLAGWLVEFLRPVLARLDQLLQQFQLPSAPKAPDETEKIISPDLLAWVVPLLQTAVVLAIILYIGWRIARALNRRMTQAEDALYTREALDSEDEADRAKRELGAKKKSLPRRAGDLTAESIRRIYAAMTARAGEAGILRREAETPYEFLPRVSSEWSDESDDLRAITEAYVAVHYGEHEATQDEVGRVKGAWKRLEETLKRSNVRTPKR